MADRALLIDFRGTLAVESPSRAAIYAAVAGRHGIVVGEEPMRALMADAAAALPLEVGRAYRFSDPWFEAYLERVFGGGLGLSADARRPLADELLARFSDPATFLVAEGAVELLGAARRRGLRTAVVSNWSERLPDLLAGLGLARLFDCVLASAVERVEKPDPEIFQRALERLAVPAGRAVHAGDRLDNDVGGARAAGIRAVLVDPSGTMDPERAGVPVVRALPALLQHLPPEEDGTG